MMNYKDKLIETIRKRNETVYLTVGFRWKNPTTMDKPMTPDEAVEWVQKSAGFYAKVELSDRNGRLCMNAYTTGDMW